MEKTRTLTKNLAVIGAVLVWLPILAPLLATALRIGGGSSQVYWYVPAALFPSALVGGWLLVWAASRAHSRQGLIGWGLAVAVSAWVAAIAIAVATGMAADAAAVTESVMALVVGLMVAYALALVEIGMAGIILMRDVLKRGIGGEGTTAPSA